MIHNTSDAKHLKHTKPYHIDQFHLRMVRRLSPKWSLNDDKPHSMNHLNHTKITPKPNSVGIYSNPKAKYRRHRFREPHHLNPTLSKSNIIYLKVCNNIIMRKFALSQKSLATTTMPRGSPNAKYIKYINITYHRLSTMSITMPLIGNLHSKPQTNTSNQSPGGKRTRTELEEMDKENISKENIPIVVGQDVPSDLNGMTPTGDNIETMIQKDDERDAGNAKNEKEEEEDVDITMNDKSTNPKTNQRAPTDAKTMTNTNKKDSTSITSTNNAANPKPTSNAINDRNRGRERARIEDKNRNRTKPRSRSRSRDNENGEKDTKDGSVEIINNGPPKKKQKLPKSDDGEPTKTAPNALLAALGDDVPQTPQSTNNAQPRFVLVFLFFFSCSFPFLPVFPARFDAAFPCFGSPEPELF